MDIMNVSFSTLPAESYINPEIFPDQESCILKKLFAPLILLRQRLTKKHPAKGKIVCPVGTSEFSLTGKKRRLLRHAASFTKFKRRMKVYRRHGVKSICASQVKTFHAALHAKPEGL